MSSPDKGNLQSHVPEHALASWDKLLNPIKLKRSLTQASVFIMAYELLKQAIIENLRGFYMDSIDGDGEISVGESYRERVVALYPKDIFHASCLWFRNSGALSDDDLRMIQRIRNHRNEVAHEIPRYVLTARSNVDADLLFATAQQLAKVDQWWIREIEIPTDPDFDEERLKGVAFDDVQSPGMIIMRIVLAVFLEDDAYLEGQYRTWQEILAKRQQRKA